MGAFSNLFLMVSLLASAALFLTLGLVEGAEGVAPSTHGNDASPPNPAQERKFLTKCADMVRRECGDEIYNGIFYQNTTASNECCSELVHMGKLCHDSLVKKIATYPEFKANASQTIPRSAQVWNKCVLVAKTITPTPQPTSSPN